jgi:hypothetical protein
VSRRALRRVEAAFILLAVERLGEQSTVLHPAPGTRRRTEVRTFTSMTGDLLAMRDWLMSEQVTLVGMEATGAYWKPIF